MTHPLRLIAPVIALALVLVATYVAYLPGLDGPFLLDDPANIQPARLSELTWHEISANVFGSERLGGISRSIGILSLAVTEYLYGSVASAFKHENLLLHLANGLLVFWLARLLFLAVRDTQPEQASWSAVVVASLWLLHPLQVSTVLYIVQRLVLLSAFFSLVALSLYIEGRRLAHRRPVAGTLVMLLGLAVFLPLGLLSKENAVLVMLVIPLIEWFVLRLHTESRRERRLLYILLAAFIAAPAALGVVYGLTHLDALLAGYTGRDFTLLERLLTQAHVIWLYLGLIVAPIPGNMSLYHDGFAIQHGLDLTTALAIAAIAATLLLAFFLRRSAPLVGLGLAWFFAWHALESTFVPLELVFEHRNYLALMGSALALVAALAPLLRERPLQLPLVLGSAAMVALLALNTAARAFVWSDVELMARTDYEARPNSPRTVETMIVAAVNRGDHAAALRYARELQAIEPSTAHPFIREVLLLCHDPANAQAPLATALALNRSSRVSPGAITLTRMLAEQVINGRCPAVTMAQVGELAAALTDNPRIHHPSSRVSALSTYGTIALLNGDRDTAVRMFKETMASAYAFSSGKFADAVEAVAQAAWQLPTKEDSLAFMDEVTRDYAQVLSERKLQVSIQAPIRSERVE
jgi:protein O-mannosyl-transferase